MFFWKKLVHKAGYLVYLEYRKSKQLEVLKIELQY